MKRNLAKILCVVITVIVIAGSFSVAASADQSSAMMGKFNIPSFSDVGEEETYFFSDDYFTAPSTTQNNHLVTMSLALAITAMNYGGESQLKTLYNTTGFIDISTTDLDIKPTRDTIGTAIAHKKIGDSELVAVAVRGGNYESEWAANVTSGLTGDAEGFSVPAKKVIERIKTYISDNNLKNVKLWVAGYSRAAAISDLVGVYVNENPDEFNTTVDDVFVFAFEAPRCSASDKVYNNIYCVKNKNDLVTYVYPRGWNLYTNGVEINIGSDKSILKVKVDLMAENKIVPLGEVSMDDFIQSTVDFIFDEISRDAYSAEFDDTVAGLIEMYYSKPSSDWTKTIDFIKNELINQLMNNPHFQYILYEEMDSGVVRHNSDKMYKQLTEELILCMNEVVKPEDLNLTQQEYQTVCGGLYYILRVLGPVLVKDYVYQENVDFDKLVVENYRDPEFDPQNEDTFIPTYEQYLKLMEEYDPQTIDEPIPYEPNASELGYEDGYEDGRAGNAKRTEAPMPRNPEDYSEDQLEAYKSEYMDEYEYGYAVGEQARIYSELPNDYFEGEDAAYKDAKNDAEKDAFVGKYKASFNEEPYGEHTKYYIKGYKDTYAGTYDRYYNKYSRYYKEMTFYHVGTFAANMEQIISEHYPQTIWDMITKLDSNYDIEVEPKRENILGDVDNDTIITASDALMILRASVDLEKFDAQKILCGDIDKDNEITSFDALMVLRFSVGYADIYNIGKVIGFLTPVGSWTGSTALGTVLAVINEDGTAVLSLATMPLKMSTTWSMEGDTVTVIIMGKPESFKFVGDTLVNVNDSTMVFAKSA